ncbi:DUF624 domain-containing protein [Halolactibacillus sp. JCM 19043]|uniref:DUF624 domain-containing protein n=1 Tax=Halolactibacillus sp. JCM 19043 TaxID=1460638 RepID=UPI000783AF75|nr:DUF624 domain-containing protein [Halolactibacillus sp. JCM 19043]
MEGKSAFMSGLYVVTDWFVNLAFLNFLFFVMTLPFWLQLINTIAAEALSVWHVGVLFILGTSLLFPSFQAMFVVLNKLLKSPDSMKLVKTYLMALKEHYMLSLKPSAFFSAMWLLLSLDYYVLNPLHSVIGWVLLFIGIIFFVWTFNFFADIVNQTMPLKKQLVSSLQDTIKRPKVMVLFLLLNTIMMFLVVMSAWFLIPFFVVSVNAVLALKIREMSLTVTN